MKTPSWLRSFRKRPSGDKTSRTALRLEVLEDRLTPAGVFPNDPGFAQQWTLHNTGQTGGTFDADIDMPEAWTVTTGSMATVVAVLDSGVDYTHPDLYLNIWLNESEIPASIAGSLVDSDGDGIFTFRDLNAAANAAHVTDMNGNGYIDGGDLLNDTRWENGIDEDGNGKVDDLIGWDTHDNDNDPQAIGEDHGTIQALHIGAIANNGVGRAGINWAVRVMPVCVQYNPATRINANAAAGLDYAVEMGASISRNRVDNPNHTFSQEMFDAIDRARLAGHLFVGAAGNFAEDIDANPLYPGAYDLDNILVVAAVDASDVLTPVSSWGLNNVDLAAPSSSGATSEATAITTGVAALLKSLHPNWTYSQIKAQILATVDPLASLAGKTVTGGRLNAASALGYTEVSVSDASAIEGDATIRPLGAFVSTGLAGESRPHSMILGPDGNLYVSIHNESGAVYRYDAATGSPLPAPGKSGAEFVSPGSGGLTLARDMAFGPDGDLYALSEGTDSVLRYDPTTGAFKDVFVASGAGGLDEPRDMLFDNGYLYVTSIGPVGGVGAGVDSVLRYDATTGAPAGLSGQPGDAVFIASGSGGLNNPARLVFGPDGMVYVTSTAPTSESPTSNSVLRYDSATGAPAGVSGQPGDAFFVSQGSGGLDGPTALVFRPDGYLYVVSWRNDSVFRYDSSTGAFAGTVVPAGSGGVDAPIDLLFEPDGNFLVTSWQTGQVLRYGAGSQAAFTVSLSDPSAVPVTVNYATANGTAVAGSDYTATSGSVTFAPGETTKTILVQTLDDTIGESSETFTVNLSNAIGAAITDGQGVGTIADNDGPQISISDVTIAEGKKGKKTYFTFTVTLSEAYAQTVTVSYQTVNGTATTGNKDYVAQSGTITFLPGETEKTITIVVNGDNTKEANEVFYVDLFDNSLNSLISKTRGIGTILNDD